MERLYKEKLRVFNEYNNVCNAIKQMLIATVEDNYIRTLRHTVFGYINFHPIQTTNHCYSEYSNINTYKLTENNKFVRSLYDISQPFESWVATIKDGIDFATAWGSHKNKLRNFYDKILYQIWR